ncbi:hypothetical protein NM688_g5904 [Phlebia brevispora]|uniref:Uncharacterized protein n=2 Tax=Phlebia brevispora TaxID=194682 RepID=A0ACC1SA56_9APHY|nr:hypothetical protein NM688_g6996 [Phlebia brevispora]KAJ3543061.1 hypothetical protein NM688_g5904 [Phlebia brevispora]
MCLHTSCTHKKRSRAAASMFLVFMASELKDYNLPLIQLISHAAWFAPVCNPRHYTYGKVPIAEDAEDSAFSFVIIWTGQDD